MESFGRLGKVIATQTRRRVSVMIVGLIFRTERWCVHGNPGISSGACSMSSDHTRRTGDSCLLLRIGRSQFLFSHGSPARQTGAQSTANWDVAWLPSWAGAHARHRPAHQPPLLVGWAGAALCRWHLGWVVWLASPSAIHSYIGHPEIKRPMGLALLARVQLASAVLWQHILLLHFFSSACFCVIYFLGAQ
jgi:hypothetical protein